MEVYAEFLKQHVSSIKPQLANMKIIAGQEMTELLESQIAAHSGGLHNALRDLDPISATAAWLDTIRAVEEFINLIMTCDVGDVLEDVLPSLPLVKMLNDMNSQQILLVKNELTSTFSSAVAERFIMTSLQAAAIGNSFSLHRIFEAAAGLQTVAHAAAYFQSRRRHMVAMLYTLPKYCRGKNKVVRFDTLNLFLPLIELNGITLTTLHEQLMLSDVYDDFHLSVEQHGCRGNYSFEPLDTLFLDPERASIVEVEEAKKEPYVRTNLEPVDTHNIFSAAELRNAIILIETAYGEFNLVNTDFSVMANLVRAFLVFCKDDYVVSLSQIEFEHVITLNGAGAKEKRLLVHLDGDYVKNTNVFSPFVQVGGAYVSSVNLLQRFIYYWKNVCLNKVRRYQIRTGFIFEESVKRALGFQGFHITDIKRINHKEFDVVAVLDDMIYNIQCKNNLVDLCRIDTDRKKFARYNRSLDRYYVKALAKEEAREHLLRDELQLDDVQHFVVSRFPVATTNPRVICFNKIDQFKNLSRIAFSIMKMDVPA